MIKYPLIKENATIGVTAPSSGVPTHLHPILKQACERMKAYEFQVICGHTAWTEDKAKSAAAIIRAKEFNEMMQNDQVQLVIPPWGGELAIEILDLIDFENMQNKWVLGYSDTSILLLAMTLKTGLATAHGPNLVDLRGEYSDETTDKWRSVFTTKLSQSITQYSSNKYQFEWQHNNPTPCLFHLTEDTIWKTVSKKAEKMEGRLLGGCIDIIRHLIGTPYGDVQTFKKSHIGNDSIIWYFENCSLNTTDLRRTLVQMKLAGWFDQCAGILFGRSAANEAVDNYVIEDVYNDLSEELTIPIIYDIDCGHEPPQMTFINGAYTVVEVENGKGKVIQYFKE